MEIGMKIYFEKATGNVIVNTGERVGRLVVETTEDQDFATYKALAERVRDTIGVVKLKYGQYGREFAECSGYRVDPETLDIEFTYPGEIPAEVIAERISVVEAENARLSKSLIDMGTELTNAQIALADNYEELQVAKQEAADAQLALTELYELVLAGQVAQPEQPVEGGEVDNG